MVSILNSSVLDDVSALINDISVLRESIVTELIANSSIDRAYADASVERLREEMNAKIDETETSLIEDYTEFGNAIRHDASVANEELEAELRGYIDASVDRLRGEHAADMEALRVETAANLNEAINTLDTSVADNIAQNVSILTDEYQAADAALEADMMAALGIEVQAIDASIAYNVSTLAGDFEDRLREMYATILMSILLRTLR